MGYHKYTEEQKTFLTDNLDKHTYQCLAKAFNARFGANVLSTSISDVCSKRMKTLKKINTGTFAVRSDRHYKRELGSEVWRVGYLFIKTDQVCHVGKTQYSQMKENWQPKHRYIYEQHFGKVLESSIVVFLDGDRTNFEIDNLYCTTRRVNVLMNSNNWFTTNRDNTLTAIKWCELHGAMMEGDKTK